MKNESYLLSISFLTLLLLMIPLSFMAYAQKIESTEDMPALDLSKIQFKDIPLAKILEVIAGSSGINIYLDEDVPDKKVSVFAKDQKLDKVLDLILETHDLCKKQVDDNTIIVFPKKKTSQYKDTEIEVFFMTQETAGKITSILKNIGKNVQVFVNDRTEAIIFFGTVEEIEKARYLTEVLDRKNKQVLVDMKLLEVDRKKMKELGPTLTEGGTYSIERLKNIDYKNAPVLIKLIESIEDTRILAQPKIRVLDKEKAHITIADRIPIEITSSSQSPTGPVQIEKRVQWLDIGIKLVIEVMGISPNDESVTLKVTTEVSSLISITAAGYPQTRVRTAESMIRLENGETVIMGGLISQDEIETWFKIPLLSDLPVLGRFFSDKKKNLSESEIIMFLTPSVIPTEPAGGQSIGGNGYTKQELRDFLDRQGQGGEEDEMLAPMGQGVDLSTVNQADQNSGEDGMTRSLSPASILHQRGRETRKLLEKLRFKVESGD